MSLGVLCIYRITNIVNGKIYIGSTKCYKTRMANHRNTLIRGVHGNKYLQNSWNKHGEESFVFEIIEIVEKQEDLTNREQFWINKTECYDNKIGYNINRNASSRFGMKLTKEHKEKIGNANRNRVYSERAIENFRNGQLGLKKSKEQVEKRVKSFIMNGKNKGENHHFYGKNFSIEHKEKISKSHRGKHTGEDNNYSKLNEEKVRQIKILLGEGRMSQKKIAEMFNVGQQNISCINTGKTWGNVKI